MDYQPTSAEEMGMLQERITSTKSIHAVYVPADDLTYQSPATALARHDKLLSSEFIRQWIPSLGLYLSSIRSADRR